MKNQINTMSLFGIIFAFLFFPLGFIFSLIGLFQAKHDNTSKTISIIGLSVSSFLIILSLVFYYFTIYYWPAIKPSNPSNTYCSQKIDCEDTEEEGIEECKYCKNKECTEKGIIKCPKQN